MTLATPVMSPVYNRSNSESYHMDDSTAEDPVVGAGLQKRASFIVT